MSPAGTTIPAAGIGVWEGARGFWYGRRCVIWEVLDGGRWATFHVEPDGGEQVPVFRYQPIVEITLDLTHHMTRLEVVARVAERGNHYPEGAIFRRVEWPATGEWGYELGSPIGNQVFTTLYGPATSRFHAWCVVPDLAALDPDDPEVDVKALAIVAARVFGSG